VSRRYSNLSRKAKTNSRPQISQLSAEQASHAVPTAAQVAAAAAQEQREKEFQKSLGRAELQRQREIQQKRGERILSERHLRGGRISTNGIDNDIESSAQMPFESLLGTAQMPFDFGTAEMPFAAGSSSRDYSFTTSTSMNLDENIAEAEEGGDGSRSNGQRRTPAQNDDELRRFAPTAIPAHVER
jgi:hypothetical protein